MSGLVAVIAAPHARPVQSAEISDLVDGYLRLRPSASPAAPLGDDRARAVSFNPTSQPLGNTPSWVAIAGLVHPSRPWTRSHAQELKDSDGHFAVVSYDAGCDEVLVANDPMGMRALFVAERAGRLYVSTSAVVLARHLRCGASRLGLQEFLLSGYQFGSRTHWDVVRRLEPATCLVVTPTSIDQRTYWRPAVDRKISALSLEEASQYSIDVARKTIQEGLSGSHHWADLTGGYDSRLLCLLLEAAGLDFATNTRSTADSMDADVAEDIAREKGWEWFDNSLPSDWPLVLPDWLDTAFVWGDSHLEVLQLARVLFAHERLALRRPGRLLSAGGGEHFQYYSWQSELFNAGRSNRFDMHRWIDMIALKPTDATVLKGSPRAAVREDFAARLAAWIEPYADELNTVQLGLMKAYKDVGHHGAYRSAEGCFLEAQLPFYFKPVFTTAISVDHRHRNGHKLMRHMISALDPQVARLRTTKGGPALPWRAWRWYQYLPYYKVVARKGINKVSERALGSPLWLPRTSFAWEQAAHGIVLAQLRNTGAVDWAQMRIGSLLDRNRFEALLARSLHPGFCQSAMLARIITAELALRVTETSIV